MQLQLAIKMPAKAPDKAITFIWYKGKWKLARAPLELITKGKSKGKFRTKIFNGYGLRSIIVAEGDIKK